MKGFRGAKIGLLEARMSSEMARLIEKNGGVVVSAPALKEETIDCSQEVSQFIDKLAAGKFDFIVFQTGVGVSALLNEADKLNCRHELIDLLNKITTICRGPKPTAVCGKNGINVAVKVKEPWTTTELIETISELELAGKGFALLHYGERNQALTEYLQSRGAAVDELLLYQWQMPDSIAPLQDLIKRIIGGELDAVAFTSQIQARHLFQIADAMDLTDQLRESLQNKILVASIGPTCSAALKSFGIKPQIEPEHPKMGNLVQALIEKF